MSSTLVYIILISFFLFGCIEKNQVKKEDIECTVAFLNIWYHSDQDSLQQVIDSVKADIFGFSEISNERLLDLQKRTGYAYALPLMRSEMDSFRITHRGVLSKFPIKNLDGFSAMVYLNEDDSVLIRTVHLRSEPYVPYKIENGEITSEQQAIEASLSSKEQEIKLHLNALCSYKEKIPTILMGDFNEPSHHDWIEENKESHAGLTVAWPTHIKMEENGYTDAFRLLYPDPIEKPGHTWSPRFRETPQDRIDFMYVDVSRLTVKEVLTFGKQENQSNWALPYFPSDHCGLLMTVTIKQN